MKYAKARPEYIDSYVQTGQIQMSVDSPGMRDPHVPAFYSVALSLARSASFSLAADRISQSCANVQLLPSVESWFHISIVKRNGFH